MSKVSSLDLIKKWGDMSQKKKNKLTPCSVMVTCTHQTERVICMGNAKRNIVIRFLKDMQLDKICVFGEEEARLDVGRLQQVIDDIECYYEVEALSKNIK